MAENKRSKRSSFGFAFWKRKWRPTRPICFTRTLRTGSQTNSFSARSIARAFAHRSSSTCRPTRWLSVTSLRSCCPHSCRLGGQGLRLPGLVRGHQGCNAEPKQGHSSELLPCRGSTAFEHAPSSGRSRRSRFGRRIPHDAASFESDAAKKKHGPPARKGAFRGCLKYPSRNGRIRSDRFP